MGHVRVVIGPLCPNSEITTFLSFFSLNKYHSISILNVREAFVFFFLGGGLGLTLNGWALFRAVLAFGLKGVTNGLLLFTLPKMLLFPLATWVGFYVFSKLSFPHRHYSVI